MKNVKALEDKLYANFDVFDTWEDMEPGFKAESAELSNDDDDDID